MKKQTHANAGLETTVLKQKKQRIVPAPRVAMGAADKQPAVSDAVAWTIAELKSHAWLQ